MPKVIKDLSNFILRNASQQLIIRYWLSHYKSMCLRHDKLGIMKWIWFGRCRASWIVWCKWPGPLRHSCPSLRCSSGGFLTIPITQRQHVRFQWTAHCRVVRGDLAQCLPHCASPTYICQFLNPVYRNFKMSGNLNCEAWIVSLVEKYVVVVVLNIKS